MCYLNVGKELGGTSVVDVQRRIMDKIPLNGSSLPLISDNVSLWSVCKRELAESQTDSYLVREYLRYLLWCSLLDLIGEGRGGRGERGG